MLVAFNGSQLDFICNNESKFYVQGTCFILKKIVKTVGLRKISPITYFPLDNT